MRRTFIAHFLGRTPLLAVSSFTHKVTYIRHIHIHYTRRVTEARRYDPAIEHHHQRVSERLARNLFSLHTHTRPSTHNFHIQLELITHPSHSLLHRLESATSGRDIAGGFADNVCRHVLYKHIVHFTFAALLMGPRGML